MHPNLLQGKKKNETELESMLLRVVLSYGAPENKQILQSSIDLFTCEIFDLLHLQI